MITPESNTTPQRGLRVPLAALSIDDVPPAVGDEVPLSGRARVIAIDGDTAELEPTEVNGQPIAAAPVEMTSDDAMRAAIEADEESDSY